MSSLTPEPASRDQITISPFYHSAVNAVTEPGRFVACSHYFVTRWMPLLGNEGTRIVLALRALGYFNPKTGERRDEIILNRTELSARVGCSKDTITRELGTDKKTGKSNNPALLHFVEKIHRRKRDPHTGQMWQEDNGYRVAMDDPIHPDDWPLVAEKVAERETYLGKQSKVETPETQNALPVRPPETQNAFPATQNASPRMQNASPETQNASRLKGILYSSLLKNTLPTAALPGISLSALEEGNREENKGDPPKRVGDPLASLSPDEYAALEQQARDKVIAELGPPICDLARRGKAGRDVKAMMRALLAGKGGWG